MEETFASLLPVSLCMCSLLRLFILGLAELRLPKDVQERKAFLALDDLMTSKDTLLGFLQDLLLLPYGSVCIASARHSCVVSVRVHAYVLACICACACVCMHGAV